MDVQKRNSQFFPPSDEVFSSLRSVSNYADKSETFTKDLEDIHGYLKDHTVPIERISVALYEEETDLLKTFSYSSATQSPLTNYQFRLSDSYSLTELVYSKRPRLIRDIRLIEANERIHTEAIRANFRTSYTVPLWYQDVFYGVVFFNSKQKDAFGPLMLRELDMVSYLIALIVSQEVRMHSLLKSTLKSAIETAGKRDFETGEHLHRVAYYSRLIAREVADQANWNDEDIEQIFQFAPLHDIGKIAVPDAVLLKKGTLNQEEFLQMKRHVEEGRKLIENILKNFGLHLIRGVEKLTNIIQYHHEKIDGSGYMSGLSGKEIPLEARVVAVADIFDALTSERPYKKAWSNERAFEELIRLSGQKLDKSCVKALQEHQSEVVQIQARFS